MCPCQIPVQRWRTTIHEQRNLGRSLKQAETSTTVLDRYSRREDRPSLPPKNHPLSVRDCWPVPPSKQHPSSEIFTWRSSAKTPSPVVVNSESSSSVKYWHGVVVCHVQYKNLTHWERITLSPSYSENARDDAARWRESIHQIYETSPTVEAAEKVDDIRNAFETVCVSAEAKLRILVRKFDRAGLGLIETGDSKPNDVVEAELAVCKHEGVGDDVIQTCRRLINLVMQRSPDTRPPNCERISDGIEVIWDATNGLTWVVAPSKLPWPGVNVRVHTMPSDSDEVSNIQSFALAHRVLDHALRCLVTSHESPNMP